MGKHRISRCIETWIALGLLSASLPAMAANPNPLAAGHEPPGYSARAGTLGAPPAVGRAPEPLGNAPADTGRSPSAAAEGSPGAVTPASRAQNPNPIGEAEYHPPALPTRVNATLHRLITALATGDRALWIKDATPAFRQATGSPARFASLAHGLTARYDLRRPWKADFLTILHNPPLQTYVWRLRLADGRQVLALLTLDKGRVAGFYLL